MSLKQMLNEMIGRPVLYHFTKHTSLRHIVETDTLMKSTHLAPYVLSLTRDYRADIDGHEDEVRITLDRNKLQSFYKITPRMDGSETERKHFQNLGTFKQDLVRRNRKLYDKEAEESINSHISKLHRFVLQIDILVSHDTVLLSVDPKDMEHRLNSGEPITIEDYKHEYAPAFILKRYNLMIQHPNFKHYKGKFKVVNKWEPVKL